MVVKRKTYKKHHKRGRKSIHRNSKIRRRGGGMSPMNPTVFPTPLPEANPGLDAAFALAQDPLNRALMSGGKKRKSRKSVRGGKKRKSRKSVRGGKKRKSRKSVRGGKKRKSRKGKK